MTEKQAIRKSINSWKRKIRWAEKQDPRDHQNEHDMRDEIGLDWRDESCALCALYMDSPGGCPDCPLRKKHSVCASWDASEKHNAWWGVSHSSTWRGWLYHARRLLKQLESLTNNKG
jgi:hypothetical protein